MNNNKITNPKTETPTGINMNDKDYITCLNSTLKEMTKNYSTAMTEASNESLYRSFNSTFQELSKLQRDVFELAFRKGWYVLETADSNKINNKYSILNQEYNDLNLNN